MAVKYGKLESAKLLIQVSSPEDVNRASRSGTTPLHSACSYGHSDCVALLLSFGASVNVRELSLIIGCICAEKMEILTEIGKLN